MTQRGRAVSSASTVRRKSPPRIEEGYRKGGAGTTQSITKYAAGDLRRGDDVPTSDWRKLQLKMLDQKKRYKLYR